MNKELPPKRDELEISKNLLIDTLSSLREWVNRLISTEDKESSPEILQAFKQAANVFNKDPKNLKNPNALLELALMAQPVSTNVARTYCSIALAYDESHEGANRLMEKLEK